MKNRTYLALMTGFALMPLTLHPSSAEAQNGRHIEIPTSSQHRPEDVGVRAHTNIMLNLPASSSSPAGNWETPGSIACIYGMVPQVSGCLIGKATQTPTGGYGTIVIVGAYDYPTAANDLATFSSYFNLPTANLSVIYATGSKPSQDSTGGWELEAALDIEYAHAMAPAAEIVLVEAASSSNSDLYNAVRVATTWASYDGGVVSMSWGGQEYSGETSNDLTFTSNGSSNGTDVTYFAATGDMSFEHSYPASSPNVVAVGGTTIERNSSGAFTGEQYWTGGGGGVSSYESIPSYQQSVSGLNGHRGTPDLAAIADPNTGVAVYDTTAYEGTVQDWLEVGGTSVATPVMAGRFSKIGLFGTTPSLLTALYGTYSGSSYQTYFRDVTQGSSSCTTGWDICTGLGTLLGSSFPIIVPSVPALNFGTFSNASSKSMTMTFTNASSSSVSVSSVQATSNLFAVTSNGCAGNLASKAVCSVTVTGDPSNISSAQSFADPLIFTSTAWNHPLYVQLTGTTTARSGSGK